MTVFAVRLPDVGEGVAEAELVEWRVVVGERVSPESVLAEVLTDKATVEISSPVAGVVAFVQGNPGDRLAVGAEIVGIELDSAEVADSPLADAAPNDAAPADTAPAEVLPAEVLPAEVLPAEAPQPPRPEPPPPASAPLPPPVAADAPVPGHRALAAPAVRHRARQLGIDLRSVPGTGVGGVITHEDLDRVLTGSRSVRPPSETVHVEQVRGVRRRISERLTSSWTEIPHITYVEAVDATELEALRAELNRRARPEETRLSLLPFVVRALVLACREQPLLNAHHDAGAGTVTRFEAVHVGIATQTPDGLVVPVVHHAEAHDLRGLAAEIGRLADAARSGRASRAELTGSTITITSLGAIGGLVTTPIINQPEVAIVGVNKLETRPVWRDGAFVPRTMFNLSSSFDHRIVDGWDAATFVQRIKTLLELPALLFVDGER